MVLGSFLGMHRMPESLFKSHKIYLKTFKFFFNNFTEHIEVFTRCHGHLSVLQVSYRSGNNLVSCNFNNVEQLTKYITLQLFHGRSLLAKKLFGA